MKRFVQHWPHLLWLSILIPVSVDQIWNVSIGFYDLRLNYFSTALGMLVFAFFCLKDSKERKRLKEFFQKQSTLFFIAFGMVGVLGTVFSPHGVRSFFFLLWTLGTIFSVLLLMQFLSFRLGAFLFRSLFLYIGVQSLLILVDFLICMPSEGKLFLGRVMVYDYVAKGGILCRPHAFYQEPGYFCGFALLVALLARTWIEIESHRIWKKITWAIYGLCLLAILLTTSRMGWLGLGIFFLFEVVSGLRQKKGVQKKKRSLVWVSMIVLVVSLGVATQWKPIYHYFGNKILAPFRDPSMHSRFQRVELGWKIFLENPWVGTGPGAAGAYLVDHLTDEPWLQIKPKKAWKRLRNDPLSQNMYTEVLSEWGVLGFLFLGGGLLFLFRTHSTQFQIQLGMTVCIIWLATQTLARFDLWLALAALSQVSYFRKLRERS